MVRKLYFLAFFLFDNIVRGDFEKKLSWLFIRNSLLLTIDVRIMYAILFRQGCFTSRVISQNTPSTRPFPVVEMTLADFECSVPV